MWTYYFVEKIKYCSCTYPDENIPQRDHCLLPLRETVHFDGLDFRDCLRMEFGSGFFGKFRPDRWYRTRLVGYRQFQTVSFKPGFRPGKIGLRPGSIFRNSTIFRCRILDRYRNKRITIDDGLPDDDRILTINRVQNSTATVPAGSAGCNQQEAEDI